MARTRFSAIGATVISLFMAGSALAQQNSQPTNEEAADALARSNILSSKVDPVEVEKCGPAEGGNAPFPVPPGAVVCTIAITIGTSEPRGGIALFFFAAGKWNGQRIM